MRKLFNFEGGRNLKNDDLLVLQEQLDRLSAMLGGQIGAFVIDGMNVTGSGPYNISEGLVYINQKVIHYPGATGVGLPVGSKIYEVAATTELPRAYTIDADTQDGVTKDNVAIGDASAAADGDETINITTAGPGRRGADAWMDMSRVIGEIITSSASGSDFDINGKGLNKWRGWQLCNGQNGTPDLRGRFVVGWDNGGDPSFDTVEETGGAKSHDHVIGSNNVGSIDIGVAGAFIKITPEADYQDTSPSAGAIGYVINDKDGNGADSYVSHSIKSAVSSNLPPYMVLAYIMYKGFGDEWATVSGGGGSEAE